MLNKVEYLKILIQLNVGTFAAGEKNIYVYFKQSIEDNARLTFCGNTVDTEILTAEIEKIYAMPPFTCSQILVKQDYSDSYQILLQRFLNHIKNGTPMLASGEDGLIARILSGAVYLLSKQHKIINLPFENAAYDAFLDRMQELNPNLKTVLSQ